MQFELQISPDPDATDKRCLIRAHDRERVTPYLPLWLAIKLCDRLSTANEDLDEYVSWPNPMALLCGDPKAIAHFKAEQEKHQASHDHLMFTLWKVAPEMLMGQPSTAN